MCSGRPRAGARRRNRRPRAAALGLWAPSSQSSASAGSRSRKGPGPRRWRRAGQSVQAIACRERRLRDCQPVLMAQHRDGERGVHRLMRPGQARERKDRARPWRRDSEACRRPTAASHAVAARQPGAPAAPRGSCRPISAMRRGISVGDERRAGLGDAGFLGGDLLDPVAEEGVVIVAERGDAADERASRSRWSRRAGRRGRPRRCTRRRGCGRRRGRRRRWSPRRS